MQGPAETAVALLRAGIPDAIAIYLFGSAARGTTHRGSDIDLAILAPSTIDPQACFDMANDLACAVNRDVDLVDLRSASTVLQMQVVGHGTCVHSSDEAARDAFENFVFASYARLNEERAGILEDIAARGSIYGG